jgi:hypothetical protein
MQKSNLPRYTRTIAGAGCALAIAAGLFAYRAKADEWNRRTVLSVGETMQIEDTVLPPGKYVLKALDSPSNRHIVQIFNGDENHVFATVLTTPSERMRPTDKTELIFWETPAGTARALHNWYYPGRLTGDEFTYPKHPLQLTQQVAAAPPPPPPAPTVEPAPAETPRTAAPEPPADNQPVEIAQNSPPPPPLSPAPPAPAANAAPATPETLPQTASPYPLFGFAGLTCLGLFGFLRLTASRAAPAVE